MSLYPNVNSSHLKEDSCCRSLSTQQEDSNTYHRPLTWCASPPTMQRYGLIDNCSFLNMDNEQVIWAPTLLPYSSVINPRTCFLAVSVSVFSADTRAASRLFAFLTMCCLGARTCGLVSIAMQHCPSSPHLRSIGEDRVILGTLTIASVAVRRCSSKTTFFIRLRMHLHTSIQTPTAALWLGTTCSTTCLWFLSFLVDFPLYSRNIPLHCFHSDLFVVCVCKHELVCACVCVCACVRVCVCVCVFVLCICRSEYLRIGHLVNTVHCSDTWTCMEWRPTSTRAIPRSTPVRGR